MTVSKNSSDVNMNVGEMPSAAFTAVPTLKSVKKVRNVMLAIRPRARGNRGQAHAGRNGCPGCWFITQSNGSLCICIGFSSRWTAQRLVERDGFYLNNTMLQYYAVPGIPLRDRSIPSQAAQRKTIFTLSNSHIHVRTRATKKSVASSSQVWYLSNHSIYYVITEVTSYNFKRAFIKTGLLFESAFFGAFLFI